MSALSGPAVAVFCGGVSAEREVSRRSGQAVFEALRGRHAVRLVELSEAALPADFDPAREVAFLTLHGTWGEDGGAQRLLEAAGAAYTGCDALASALCMDKWETKRAAAVAGVPVARDLAAGPGRWPTSAAAVLKALGPEVVLKPRREGSSVGLRMLAGEAAVAAVLAQPPAGEWLLEERVRGRELTVGLIDGRALPVVEILPEGGVYDYARKYTAGTTRYVCPAELTTRQQNKLRDGAEAVFAACGCRDFARADFLARANGTFAFLEINTLPGMTATSLLPIAARARGLDFPALCERMLAPALARFAALHPLPAPAP